MNDEKNYEETTDDMMNALFQEVWDDLETGKIEETISGLTKTQTLTDTRIAFVMSQKASNLLQVQVNKKMYSYAHALKKRDMVCWNQSK